MTVNHPRVGAHLLGWEGGSHADEDVPSHRARFDGARAAQAWWVLGVIMAAVPGQRTADRSDP